MRWHCLGHAMWLVEAGGLRLLFDPLLSDRHHGGVFGVRPRRQVHAEALRPDFIFVSHRHGDHFDVPSLGRLAQLDPDAVVVTPDELVAWAARGVGFRQVHLLPPGQLVELDAARVVTTPSLAPLEWGAVVEAGGVAGWNQVDTVFRGPEHVGEVVDHVLDALGRGRDVGLDLAIVRWQPLQEIAAPMCEDLRFPLKQYGALLAEANAARARTLVPGAAGQEQVDAYAWMSRHVYPVPEGRWLRDVAVAAPESRGLAHRVGSTYTLERDGVAHDLEGGLHLAEATTPHVPTTYSPFTIPELVDPEIGQGSQDAQRERVARWMHEQLAPALAAAWPSMNARRPLSLCVEVVWGGAREHYTFCVGPEGARAEARFEPDWDVLDQIAGSMLHEVIEGRFHWGDVLLGGMLRATSRAYVVTAGDTRRATVGKTFLYYGLAYDEANERAVRHAVASWHQ